MRSPVTARIDPARALYYDVHPVVGGAGKTSGTMAALSPSKDRRRSVPGTSTPIGTYRSVFGIQNLPLDTISLISTRFTCLVVKLRQQAYIIRGHLEELQ